MTVYGRQSIESNGPTSMSVLPPEDIRPAAVNVSSCPNSDIGGAGRLTPLSPHFDDLLERQREHRPFTIPTGRTAVDAARTSRLVLEPR